MLWSVPITLYQMQVVPVPIRDQNIYANSYTRIQISKPYIALNDEVYIFFRHKGLRSCKHIRYNFYCEELFIVKHKSKYSFETTILFDLSKDIIKDSCTFKYYFDNTYIKHAVLDGGKEIILGNWLNKKSLKYTSINDIPSKIPDCSYILVNRSIHSD